MIIFKFHNVNLLFSNVSLIQNLSFLINYKFSSFIKVQRIISSFLRSFFSLKKI